ncbi:MAG TPA: LLM class flavin-dependent oxidoreductase [Bryobacteraceae bacterium]|nr:LLM class flavin-dependent oxidoreductase [Bryobacteraceae bacterium]
MSLPLGVLDQSPIPEGCTPGDALRNTLDLARMVDTLGYTRYWLAEHHGAASLACASPEVMIGPVAAATTHLRVGSGGVMLPHYSALKVAESFSMLEGLFPGRIDLGIGRAAGTSPRIAHALQRDRRYSLPDDFPEQLSELMGYLANQRPSAHSHFESPELWLLGSSEQSSIWAAERGLPYAFADFINPEGAAYAQSYRRNFVSRDGSQPHVAVAVSAICADTDEEAMHLSFSQRMSILMLFRGRTIPIPSVARAEAFLRDEGMPPELLPVGRRLITGSPATVRQAIETVAQNYNADELMVVTNTYDHNARRRSFQLIAEALRP